MIFFWPPTIVSTNCAPERERVNALLPSWRGVLKFFSNRKTFRKPKTKKKQEKKENLGRECSITIYIPTCNQQRPLVYIFLFLFSSLPFFDVWTVWRVVREGNHDYKMMTLGCPLFGNKERIFFSLLFLDGKKKRTTAPAPVAVVFFFSRHKPIIWKCVHIYLNYKPTFLCLFGEGRKTQDECCEGCVWSSAIFSDFIFPRVKI